MTLSELTIAQMIHTRIVEDWTGFEAELGLAEGTTKKLRESLREALAVVIHKAVEEGPDLQHPLPHTQGA